MKVLRTTTVALALTIAGCGGKRVDAEIREEVVEEAGKLELPQIEIGFNAKGDLNNPAQLSMVDALMDDLSTEIKSHMHIRVSAGTRSQRRLPSDWAESDVRGWCELQKKHGFGLVYVVNGNDAPENQAEFVAKWLAYGAKFSFIELMNETYLSKYREGDASRPGAEGQITIEDYTDRLVPAFSEHLAPFDVPLYLVFAPKKGKGKKRTYNDEWNEAVGGFASQAPEGHTYGAVVHLYFDGGEYDYGQIDRLRAMLPEGTPIAVTEAGLSARTGYNYDERGELIEAHYRKINARLKPGEYLFDHILYTDYDNDMDATLHPNYKGISPKGEYVLRWMRDVYPESEE